MIQAGQDLTPAMRSIGEHPLNSTRKRFADDEAPDGTPWAPLSETTKKRKRRNVDRILTERGYLGGTIAPCRQRLRGDRQLLNVLQYPPVRRQEGRVRRCAHKFARPVVFQPITWGDIPARSFLGLSDEDETAISQEIHDYITAPWD